MGGGGGGYNLVKNTKCATSFFCFFGMKLKQLNGNDVCDL